MYFNLVIYWKKTGLLRTKISNHNIIYSHIESVIFFRKWNGGGGEDGLV
jgi:hypothetical protein